MKKINRFVLAAFLMVCASPYLFAHAPGETPTDAGSSPSGGSPASSVDRGENTALQDAVGEKVKLEMQVQALQAEFQQKAKLIHDKQTGLHAAEMERTSGIRDLISADLDYMQRIIVDLQGSANEQAIKLVKDATTGYNNLLAKKEALEKEMDQNVSNQLKDEIKAQTARYEQIIEFSNNLSAQAKKVEELQKKPVYKY